MAIGIKPIRAPYVAALTAACAAALVAVGWAVTWRPDVTVPVVVTVLAVAAGIAARGAAAAAVIFVAPLATAQVSGIGAVGVLAASLAIYAVRQRAILHPLVLFGLPASLYMLIGGANLSTYRGTLTDATMKFIAFHLLAALLGTVLVGGVASRQLRQDKGLPVPAEWRIAAIVPGALGVLMAFGSAGLAIVHPYTRANIGGLALLLSESLQVGVLLWACHAFSRQTLRRRDLGALALLVVALAMPGYRGWPVIGIILITIAGVYFGRIRVRIRTVVILFGLVVFLVAGGEYIRRNTTGGQAPGTQLTTQQLAARYGAEGIPPGLLELHFALRETVGLTQVLVINRDRGRRVSSSLLLGDFKTLLPGKQTSGLVALNELIAIRGSLGLTAGAVGVSYMDLGRWSLVLFFAVGGVMGVAWRMAARDARWAMFYFLIVIYSIQWLHRGTPKASYVVVPAMFLALASLSTPSASWRAGRTRDNRDTQSAQQAALSTRKRPQGTAKETV